MNKVDFTLTRRHAMRLLLVTPLATGLAGPAQATTFEDQMRLAIAKAKMPLPGTVLELVHFNEEVFHGKTRMTAVVRMIWQPGTRTRKFVAENRMPDFALSALIAETVTEFTDAGCR